MRPLFLVRMASPLPWIKLYGDLPGHRKSVTLAALLGEPRAWTHVVELWLWVSRHAPDGNLGEMPPVAIASVAGWRGDADSFVNAMRVAGFLDGSHIRSWGEHNGAHQRKQVADKARNARLTSGPEACKNPPTSDSLVNRELNTSEPAATRQPLTSVESRELREDKENTKTLAILEIQPGPQEATPLPRRRGRPPKDASIEAAEARRREKEDGERWMARARALVGLSASEAPWSAASWMAFRRAREKRGIDQLMRALDGLEGDTWASQLSPGALLSANVIEKGLARGKSGRGQSIEETWNEFFAQEASS